MLGVLGYDGWASPSVKLFGTKKALKDYLETLKEETKCLINKMYSKEINSHQSQIIKKWFHKTEIIIKKSEIPC
ncbi:MAG: hypothetical protein IPF58_13710 [Saprospirales bacterium]|nr:hypothetical protein [Saprospirales bacterium]